jgi:hypothetical protein
MVLKGLPDPRLNTRLTCFDSFVYIMGLTAIFSAKGDFAHQRKRLNSFNLWIMVFVCK